MKLLAILGFIHLMGVAYNVPMQWFGTHADAFLKGYKSYMLNGMCGAGTGYPCTAPGRPIPRADRAMAEKRRPRPDRGVRDGSSNRANARLRIRLDSHCEYQALAAWPGDDGRDARSAGEGDATPRARPRVQQAGQRAGLPTELFIKSTASFGQRVLRGSARCSTAGPTSS
jgi:hypothetical protein